MIHYRTIFEFSKDCDNKVALDLVLFLILDYIIINNRDSSMERES